MLTGGADGTVKLWGPPSSAGRGGGLLRTFRAEHPPSAVAEAVAAESGKRRIIRPVVEAIVYVCKEHGGRESTDQSTDADTTGTHPPRPLPPPPPPPHVKPFHRCEDPDLFILSFARVWGGVELRLYWYDLYTGQPQAPSITFEVRFSILGATHTPTPDAEPFPHIHATGQIGLTYAGAGGGVVGKGVHGVGRGDAAHVHR